MERIRILSHHYSFPAIPQPLNIPSVPILQRITPSYNHQASREVEFHKSFSSLGVYSSTKHVGSGVVSVGPLGQKVPPISVCLPRCLCQPQLRLCPLLASKKWLQPQHSDDLYLIKLLTLLECSQRHMMGYVATRTVPSNEAFRKVSIGRGEAVVDRCHDCRHPCSYMAAEMVENLGVGAVFGESTAMEVNNQRQ